jgi:hypothetical protein
MKPLLVGSVFINDNELQRSWLDCQLRCLRQTTSDFDHVVVLAEGATTNYFQERTKIVAPSNTKTFSEAHREGLSQLLQYFLQNGDYENFLFLDSDAFPIRKDWLPFLLSKMKPQQILEDGTVVSHKSKEYEVAGVVRSENLETKLHASVLFVRGQFLKNIEFSLIDPIKDMLIKNDNDITIPYYENYRKKALPLIRTNKANIHPVACGVYYDTFYHHACGSGRPADFRTASYYSGITDMKVDLSGYTQAVLDDPWAFVSGLAGWNYQAYEALRNG